MLLLQALSFQVDEWLDDTVYIEQDFVQTLHRAAGGILFALVHPHLIIDYNGQHQPPTGGGA